MTRSNLLFSLPWKGRGGEGVLAALSVVVFLLLLATILIFAGSSGIAWALYPFL